MTPAELEDLHIDAAVGAIALLFAAQREERRQGGDRRAEDRGELDRRNSLEDAREAWDRR